MTLYEQLIQLNNSDMYPLHMPGHKRQFTYSSMGNMLGIDITEIDDFDDLHDANGIIRDMEIKLANLYGAGEAYISVNGSTAANEAAVLYGLNGNKEIIVARNSHKSIYYAMELALAKPIYIMPKAIGGGILGTVTKKQVEEQMELNPDCKTVVITSPTYEGIIADVRAIAETVHKYGGLLIVDCAHGAHFGLSKEFPDNPISLGADIVIVSLHKMLPAPTQTALIMISKDAILTGRVKKDLLKHYMRMFQSSSPSYILMAGIGELVSYIETHIQEDAEALSQRIGKLYKKASSLKHISLELPYGDTDADDVCLPAKNIIKDECKLVISACDGRIRGRVLYDLLRNEYRLQCEMCGSNYALGLLTVSDSGDGFERIERALSDIDARIERGEILVEEEFADVMPQIPIIHNVKCTISKALSLPKKEVMLDDGCIGRVSAEYICAYPPGMPILAPGEVISREIFEYLQNAILVGLNIQGLREGKLIAIFEEG